MFLLLWYYGTIWYFYFLLYYQDFFYCLLPIHKKVLLVAVFSKDVSCTPHLKKSIFFINHKKEGNASFLPVPWWSQNSLFHKTPLQRLTIGNSPKLHSKLLSPLIISLFIIGHHKIQSLVEVQNLSSMFTLPFN